jgi:hemin uptake protein HemP
MNPTSGRRGERGRTTMQQTNEKVPAAESASGPEVILDARELFAGRKEIVIDHEGVQYRLRITRRNKLILQK